MRDRQHRETEQTIHRRPRTRMPPQVLFWQVMRFCIFLAEELRRPKKRLIRTVSSHMRGALQRRKVALYIPSVAVKHHGGAGDFWMNRIEIH
jgi:hypothetical protein